MVRQKKQIQELNEIIELDSNEGFAYYALHTIYKDEGNKGFRVSQFEKGLQ